MTTGFQVDGSDFDDLYVRRDLFSEGGLFAWGFNSDGQLGDNSVVSRSSPVKTVSGGVNWFSVAAGSRSSAGIKSDGTLWVWGLNDNGQLGINSIASRSSPVQTVSATTNWRQIAGGELHFVAIKTDGSLWSWGSSAGGELGNNSILNRSSPVQTVAAGNNWRQASAGAYITAAIKTDGTLWVWGENTVGCLGTNNVILRSSPVQTVAGGTNWKQIACGSSHMLAIKTDGTLWVWGDNQTGQLGINNIAFRSSPVQTVAGGTNWKQVSGANYTSAAIKTDGTLWVWGNNGDIGVLGDNSIISRSSPVQVGTNTNWKYVKIGYTSSAGIKTDGTLWTWGMNTVGDNTIVDRSSPVQTAAGGTNWKQVSISYTQFLAIRDDYWT